MKAYIITKGEYSDYHICAVTLDKDKAEQLKKLFTNDWHDTYVEEFEIDEHFPIDYPYFIVEKYSDRIEVKEIQTGDYACEYDYGVVRHYDSRGLYSVCVKAKDKDHAKKIALDKIAQYKAEKLGL